MENTDRKILLYLIVFKIAMFDISIFTFRITYIVLYNTVNNSLNYHIPYRTVNSSLNHNIPYSTVNSKQMNWLLQVDKVITELTRCLALNRILHGAGHWKLARCHANLAEAYLDLKSKCQTGSALSFTLNLILTVLNFACLLVLERKAAAVMFSTVPSFPKFSSCAMY